MISEEEESSFCKRSWVGCTPPPPPLPRGWLRPSASHRLQFGLSTLYIHLIKGQWPLMRILCPNFFSFNCKRHRQKKNVIKNKYKPTISTFVNIPPVCLCVMENNIYKQRSFRFVLLCILYPFSYNTVKHINCREIWRLFNVQF